MKRKLRKQMRKFKPLNNKEKDSLARLICENLPTANYTNEGRFCPS